MLITAYRITLSAADIWNSWATGFILWATAITLQGLLLNLKIVTLQGHSLPFENIEFFTGNFQKNLKELTCESVTFWADF